LSNNNSSRKVPSDYTVVLPIMSDVEARRRERWLGKVPVEELPDTAVGGNLLFCLACALSCLCKFEMLRLVMLTRKY
jgi:hypothetical protein